MMKKQILVLAFATLCATTSAMAMEDLYVDNKTTGKRFAVIPEAKLLPEFGYTLNYHVDTQRHAIPRNHPIGLKTYADFEVKECMSKESSGKNIRECTDAEFVRLTQKLVCFEIKDSESEGHNIAFPVSWNIVQSSTHSDKVAVYPWNLIQQNSYISDLSSYYRVVEHFDGILSLNTCTSESKKIGKKVYYFADVSKKVPGTKGLKFIYLREEVILWNLKKPIVNINPFGRRQEYAQHSTQQEEADFCMECYDEEFAPYNAEIRGYVKEALQQLAL